MQAIWIVVLAIISIASADPKAKPEPKPEPKADPSIILGNLGNGLYPNVIGNVYPGNLYPGNLYPGNVINGVYPANVYPQLINGVGPQAVALAGGLGVNQLYNQIPYNVVYGAPNQVVVPIGAVSSNVGQAQAQSQAVSTTQSSTVSVSDANAYANNLNGPVYTTGPVYNQLVRPNPYVYGNGLYPSPYDVSLYGAPGYLKKK